MKSPSLVLIVAFICCSFLVSRASASPGHHCYLPPDPGPCYANFPRYFFNPRSRRCQRFSYGGCEGNANNYENYYACRYSCGRY
ncbi:kunitz-type serine protease inhibitor-like [Oratosquilla oratoria]|uniref:kunitz-type serine protease inhibitor-like n=1 Tax=Oratosquilla oratoria TaxID=337810 RepID=UPI003F765058